MDGAAMTPRPERPVKAKPDAAVPSGRTTRIQWRRWLWARQAAQTCPLAAAGAFVKGRAGFPCRPPTGPQPPDLYAARLWKNPRLHGENTTPPGKTTTAKDL